MDATAVVAIITLAGSLLISAFTQRSAKTTTVVPEYQSLTKDLREQVTLQGLQIKELQEIEAKRRKRARTHEPWDQKAVNLLPPDFPPPPPLEVWDD